MAQSILKIETNLSEFSSAVKRLAEYIDTAPDDDPVKEAMLAYGAIDLEHDITQETSCVNGVTTITYGFKPAFQKLVDMVPAQ
ncbi:hypothetical protein [Sulfitobacter sp. M22]|uniref:hypothetical protein n=1 Tax=Sulfitobacter sp. M22 TaxID=2675332 RepID=UPI001F1FEC60|nr:hypothetical protein [Sulfitobacter sp. M22]MCF7725776.1 hypothetical protein [Sulfitobacter sp. M22]